jgi:hypothetical protein
MVLPHHPEFRFRPHVFWGSVLLSLLLAVRVPGVAVGQLLAFIAVCGVVSGALYLYTRWMVRFDGGFRYVHPRKIFVTSLLTFYAPAVLGVTLLLGAPCFLHQPWMDSPLDRVMYFLAIPCLLAAAAGAYRGFAEAYTAG